MEGIQRRAGGGRGRQHNNPPSLTQHQSQDRRCRRLDSSTGMALYNGRVSRVMMGWEGGAGAKVGGGNNASGAWWHFLSCKCMIHPPPARRRPPPPSTPSNLLINGTPKPWLICKLSGEKTISSQTSLECRNAHRPAVCSGVISYYKSKHFNWNTEADAKTALFLKTKKKAKVWGHREKILV